MAVDPIINDLQYVMETSQELDILNFYKSFPITCRASVVGIDHDTVELHAQPPGSVCLEEQEETVILSRGLPEAVRARVVFFDLPSGALKLNDFSYVGSHFGDRKITRVQPDELLPVEIEAEGSLYSGQLLDVSLSGVGLYLAGEVLSCGQMIQLTLPLPEGKISLPGKVLNMSEGGQGQVRYSVGFTRNAQEIAVVMRYIKDRRVEILDEVERMYKERTSPGSGG